MSKLRYGGLDVHAETIAVAVAEPTGEVRSVAGKKARGTGAAAGVLRGRPDGLRALLAAHGAGGRVLFYISCR
jgi:hypothetical protein